MKKLKKITFPTCLTLVRLIFAPIFIPFFIVYYVPENNFIVNFWVAILFLLFGLTDYLDGFFARKYSQESQLGATLDHLADKFLTFSAFIALLTIHKIYFVWVLLLVGRELFIMGLREIALDHAMVIHVSSLGKLKTCVHIAFITWIILNPAQQTMNLTWNGIESILLLASLSLAWYSAFRYFIIFYAQLKK